MDDEILIVPLNSEYGNRGFKVVKQSTSPPSYTLAELQQLAREWADDIRLNTVDRLIVGQLLIWLAKREQGEVSNNVD